MSFDSFDQAVSHSAEAVHRVRRRPLETLYRLFPRVTALLDGGVPQSKAILTDIDILDVPAMKGLRYKSRRACWFSLPHGIDPRLPLVPGQRRSAHGLDIRIYASSEAEARHYHEWYGVPESRIKIVGVPRHSKSWIGRLRDYYGRGPAEKGRFIFLASRPVNRNNFPPARKRELLEALRTVADELECNIVVRLHPKETDADRSIIEHSFGRERLGDGWNYSTLPAMIGADGALFAATMFSSVAVDMLAVDVPAIELFDFAGLSNPSLVPDLAGHVRSIYQHLGLVYGAANLAELEAGARAIVTDRVTVLTELKDAYNRTFADPGNAINTIVGDLTEALGAVGRRGRLG